MMNSGTPKNPINRASLFFYGLSVALLIAGGFLHQPVQQERQKMRIVMDNDINQSALSQTAQTIDQSLVNQEQLPASTAMMLAIGGPLRGIMVNVLWYQANQLQQENRHFQAATHARWLTRLMPRYPMVWDFLSWNMAWNISVKHKYPEQRWAWIQKGINMLQRDAIPLNPDAPLLYKQLAWIYFFKIGGDMDDMHWHYKREFISKWHFLLGAPPNEDRIKQFEKMTATSPILGDLKSALNQEKPLLAKKLDYLIDTFTDAGYQLDDQLLIAIQKNQDFANSYLDELLQEGGYSERIKLYDPALTDTISDPRYQEALEIIQAHLRHKILLTHHAMQPVFMLELMQTHGPFDWRHPMAHGLYWAEMGVAVSEKVGRQKGLELLNTRRSALQNIQLLSWQGTILFDPIEYTQQSNYIPRFLPHPEMVEAYHQRLVKDREQLGSNLEKYKGTGIKSFRRGHQNFLETAVRDFYLSGDVEAAKRYQKILKDDFTKFADKQDKIDYAGSIDVFAWRMVSKELVGQRNIKAFINSMVRQGAVEGLGKGKHGLFKHKLNLARQAFSKHELDLKLYPQQTARTPALRTQLPPLKQMVEDTLADILKNNAESLTRRATIYQELPDDLKSSVYPNVIDRLKQELKNTNLKVDKLFPEPPAKPKQEIKSPKQVRD